MNFLKCRLVRWDGPLPETGEYLKTEAGSHYAIVGLKSNTRENAKSICTLTLLKLTPEETELIPENSPIHHFQWRV